MADKQEDTVEKEDVVKKEDTVKKEEVIKEVPNEEKKEEEKATQEPEGKKRKVLPFVTESDVFEVLVRYYRENHSFYIEGVDDDFKEEVEDVQEIICTLKYPNQGDITLINAQASNFSVEAENFDLRDLAHLEFIRFLVLVRKWNLDETLNNAAVIQLHPKIIKTICMKIREEIGLEAII